jgi:4-hydroxybenzoate polyprenyltransferase
VAVTALVALLCVGAGKPPSTAITVTAAVFCGQLTIGWGNDLLDADRDRRVGRSEKPLASGALPRRLVLGCLAAAAVACVVLSFAVGWRSALVHLFLGVAWGHAYNLGLKATPLSWLPYAVAFGSLPAVVTLAGTSPVAPPWWMVVTAAVLGVAAHFLNALPDLADDVATGVRGLPQRIGPTATRTTATVLLVGGSAVAVLGPSGTPSPLAWTTLGLVVALGLTALAGRGRVPFYAAVLIALLDAALLVATGT